MNIEWRRFSNNFVKVSVENTQFRWILELVYVADIDTYNFNSVYNYVDDEGYNVPAVVNNLELNGISTPTELWVSVRDLFKGTTLLPSVQNIAFHLNIDSESVR